MHFNGKIDNILQYHTDNFANFDGSGSPWWVIFDAKKPINVAMLEMAAYVNDKSPKKF